MYPEHARRRVCQSGYHLLLGNGSILASSRSGIEREMLTFLHDNNNPCPRILGKRPSRMVLIVALR
jgi:hypothetical protein